MKSVACTVLAVGLALSGCTNTSTLSSAFDDGHRYWDGFSMPSVDTSKKCSTQLEWLSRAYRQPELMAIGDSLYNGVQSLRINWWLSEWSPPSLVAVRLGLIKERNGDRTGVRAFYGPQYRTHDSSPIQTQSYGFDLENIPNLPSLPSVPRNQATALEDLALRYQPPNGRALVDNIAFSGANSSDLFAWTAGDYKKAAVDAIARTRSGLGFSALADAFFYSNAYFVLNPTKNSCLDKLTAIEQVELRKPKRLLINIGSNNGLYRLAFEAAKLKDEACNTTYERKVTHSLRCNAGTIEDFITDRYFKDIRIIFDRLARVPGLEAVYFNNLALPSQPANLVYEHGQYRSALFGNRRVSGAELRASDALVRRVNASVHRIIDNFNSRKTGLRFVYVDQEGQLAKLDYKSCLIKSNASDCEDRRLRISSRHILNLEEGADILLDNRPLLPEGPGGYVTGPSFNSKSTQGGLFSFDNMHLSTVGYELMAKTVLDRMQQDALYIPAFVGGRDTCPNRGDETFGRAPEGACAALLTTPGWSYADSTRRDFNFLRIAGQSNLARKELLKALFNFVSRFTD